MIKKYFKKLINNDIFRRAIKTFIQGFLASFILSLKNMTSWDEKLLKSALLGALAGGFSALMNYVYSLLKKEE